MLLKGDMDLPSEVLAAQRSGRLVIFAGAGVSIPSPSDLPSFKDLANRVAVECGRSERVEDPSRIEEFLGSLEEQGASVHETVKTLIADPSSKPNHLHKLVVQLFDSNQALRIVTSNFDCHFESATEERFGGVPDIYRAPALPLGDDFHGVIKLHGSVDDVARRLVVTDRDFGRAYLTEGWATRFLMSLYQEFIVLFVGYSHDDTVMKYLARGLPGRLGGTRFALTPEAQRGKWRALGVTAIPYPPGDDGPHSNLVTAIQSWVRRSRMGVLQHERRIREITSTPPPSDPELADYVTLMLSDETTARFFTDHARDVAWLRWVEDKGLLRALFGQSPRLEPHEVLLASWLARSFACEFPEAALGVIHRAGGSLHPFLWHEIAHRVWTRDPRPDPDVFGKWVSLLVQDVPPRGSDYLGCLLQKAVEEGLDHASLVLLENLISPQIELRPYLGFFSDEPSVQEVTPETTFPAAHHSLQEAWSNGFKPRLDEFYDRLIGLLTEALSRTRTLQSAWAPTDRTWDPVSYSRAAIEPHPQDDYPSTIDVIVDAARDTLEWMLEHKPRSAEVVIDSWATSDSPILQRLAVHGVTEHPGLSHDEKVAVVEVAGWLYRHRLKHEVFRLLAENFDAASAEWQQRLLHEAEEGPQGDDAERLERRTRDYVKYNLLVWLKQCAPDSPIVREAFDRNQEEHSDFAPREQPDLDSFSVEFEAVSSPSPVSVDELLKLDPSVEERLTYLIEYSPEGPRGWEDRSGLLGNVSSAARERYEWGISLAEALATKSEWASDLWGALISAWREQSLEEDQWSEVLGLMSDHGDLALHIYEMSSWLEHSLTSSPGVPSSQLEKVESLLLRLWESSTSEQFTTEDSEDWLTMAINVPEGRVFQAVLQALSRRRREAEDWVDLPQFYRELFESAIYSQAPRGSAARLLIASQPNFLLALDHAWTTQHVIPLFDWESNGATAEQAWHGFVGWGRLSEALIGLLIPFYEQSFSRLPRLKRFKDRFIGHVALISVIDASVALDLVRQFLASAEDADRGTLATSIGRQVSSLGADDTKQLWDSWLRHLIELRVSGIPVAVQSVEAAAIGEWPISMSPVFGECTELVIQLPPAGKQYSRFFEDLLNAEAVWVDPDTTLSLIVHRLKGFQQHFWQCDEASECVRKAHSAGGSDTRIRDALDELARLACPEAPGLRDALLP